MRRETENTILLLVGVSVGLIAIGGEFTRYVKPGLLPWLLVTSALLIGLALVAILGDIRRGGAPRDHDDGHAHRGGIAWLLVVPIVVLIFVKPPPMSAQASTPTVDTNQTVLQHFPPIPPGRAPEVSVPDVVMRAANDKSGSLTDRLITVTAFVLHEKDGADLGRIVIICCAADAQLARIHLRGPAAGLAAALPDNTWVRAEGVATPAPYRTDIALVPTLNATALTRVDAPPNPYAYPRG